MKRKLISTVAALAMTASMSMPVFAATQQGQGGAPSAPPQQANSNTQNSEVPVVGNIGRWKNGNTDINNPNNPNSGSQGEHTEVQKPGNVTDINVTVPTSMTFDVVTNTTDNNPVLASGEYTITNNGTKPVTMEGTYTGGNTGDITLVNIADVTAKSQDNKIELGLSLDTTTGTKFISNVKNGAQSSPIDIANGSNTILKFNSTDKGMSDVKQEAFDGTFKNEKKVTTGTLTLTFTQP